MRHRTVRSSLSVAALASLGVLPPRLAEAFSDQVGADYLSRPLVLPQGTLRIDGGARRPYFGGQLMPAGQFQFFVNDDLDDSALLVPGAAYGAMEDLELGGSWPLRISPGLDLLDLSLYGKYSLQRGQVEVAAFAELRVPVQDDLEIGGGVPVYVHLDRSMRLETGGFLRVRFGADTTVSLHAPVSLPIAVSPQVFVGPEVGIEIIDFDMVSIPLGVIAGYTLGSGISAIGDLFGRLTLVHVGSGTDAVRFDVGAELYFDL